MAELVRVREDKVGRSRTGQVVAPLSRSGAPFHYALRHQGWRFYADSAQLLLPVLIGGYPPPPEVPADGESLRWWRTRTSMAWASSVYKPGCGTPPGPGPGSRPGSSSTPRNAWDGWTRMSGSCCWLQRHSLRCCGRDARGGAGAAGRRLPPLHRPALPDRKPRVGFGRRPRTAICVALASAGVIGLAARP